MSDKHTNGLHLPDLSIRNFRGIELLEIARLGRVTLLGGRNGVGKTTVLEAVRVHAARGHPNILREVLNKHEETAPSLDENLDQIDSPDCAALFNGRIAIGGRSIRIGPSSASDDLCIDVLNRSDWPGEQQVLFDRFSRTDGVQTLKISYQTKERFVPWLSFPLDWRIDRIRRSFVEGSRYGKLDNWEWPVIKCESLGPGLPSNRKLALFWDSVVLTAEENLSLKALRLASDGVEGVAVVGDEVARQRGTGRRIVVKMQGHSAPVPLKSLGDGITRLFAAGLALASSSGGFLVVDEAENGIHYSVQQEFWRLVLRAAHQHNVQVLATTHSNDCVAGFARAATEVHEVEGAYVRLEREGDRIRAVEYTEEELFTVAEQGIEAR